MRARMDGMKFCREGHAAGGEGAPQANGWVRACSPSYRRAGERSSPLRRWTVSVCNRKKQRKICYVTDRRGRRSLQRWIVTACNRREEGINLLLTPHPPQAVFYGALPLRISSTEPLRRRYACPCGVSLTPNPLRERRWCIAFCRWIGGKKASFATLRTVEDAGPYDGGRFRYRIEREKREKRREKSEEKGSLPAYAERPLFCITI